jgi:lambda repressor-like predicted transcriptional regulator
MRSRCYQKSNSRYNTHGARGITVCEAWHSFDGFFADMGPRPDGMSLDRIDNDGNYEPGNCRWTTNKVQANNRRSNRLITYNGQTMTLQQLADSAGMNRRTLAKRLSKSWTVEDAISIQVRKHAAKLSVQPLGTLPL